MLKKDTIITLLKKAKVFVTDDSDVLWTKYVNPIDFRNDIDSWVKRLESHDESALSEISLAFAPTASFQEHALSNGWGEEYLALAAEFDQCLHAVTKQDFPEDDDKQVTREPRSVFLFNLFAVLFTTFAVAAVYWGACFWSAYNTGSKTRVRQVFTLNTIRHLATELEKYRNENKVYPDSLSDIHESLPNDDAWHNPMVYTSDGNSWEIRSLGADGKEGGTGLNTDIVVNDRMYEEKTTEDAVTDAVPTFAEIGRSFLNDSYGNAQLAYGILFPVCIFLVMCYFFFLGIFPIGRSMRHEEVVIITLGTIIASSFFAAFLAFFHSIPSGH